MKFDFDWGSDPDTAGVAYNTPTHTFAAFKGPTLKGTDGTMDDREGQGKGG